MSTGDDPVASSPADAAYAARDLSALINLMNADQQERFKLHLLRDAMPRFMSVADAYVLEHFGDALQALQQWLVEPTEDNFQRVAVHNEPSGKRLVGTARIWAVKSLISAALSSASDVPRLIDDIYTLADALNSLPSDAYMAYWKLYGESREAQRQGFISRLEAIAHARDQWFLGCAHAILVGITPAQASMPYDSPEAP